MGGSSSTQICYSVFFILNSVACNASLIQQQKLCVVQRRDLSLTAALLADVQAQGEFLCYFQRQLLLQVLLLFPPFEIFFDFTLILSMLIINISIHEYLSVSPL